MSQFADSNLDEIFSSIPSRWSGYDRYAVRRSLYSSDGDSGIVASSPSTDSSNSSTFPIALIPTRFQFHPHLPSPESSLQKKNRFSWASKFLSKKPKPEDPLRILNKVASCKISTNYKLTSVDLGKGVSGSVFLVKRKVDNERFAAKSYTKKSHDGKYSRSKFLLKIAKEVVMLSQLHHENVIRTFDIVSHQDQIVTIMELCPVNLFRLVKDKALSLADILELFSQLGAGVAYLHNECGIAHRDLKLENIGLGTDRQIKILDFGSAICLNPQSSFATIPNHTCPVCPPDTRFSCRSSSSSTDLFGRIHSQSSQIKVRGLCGSDPYIAPEIWETVAGARSSCRNMSTSLCRCCRLCGYDPFKADIWSLGVIFIAMLSGKFPWAVAKPNDNDFNTFKMHRRHRLSRFKVPSGSLKLTLGMLNLCPQERLDIDQVMAYTC